MKNEHIKKKILELDDIQTIEPNLDLLKLYSRQVAEKIQTIIFDKDKKTLAVLTTNNYPQMITQVLDRIEEKGYKFEFYYTDEITFSYCLSWYDQLDSLEEIARKDLEEKQNATGVDALDMIKRLYSEKDKYSEGDFIEEIIRFAFQAGSSDLHFQPEELGVVLRVRKDGVLRNVITFEHKEFKKYFTKLKYMSGVKLNVEHNPQDGRFDFEAYRNGKKSKIDVRVSFMPGLRGESVVMRFLDGTKGIMSFSNIGFMDDSLNILQENLKKNYGMILVTGPTGSGKTTTLYSMLNQLNDSEKKIITLEDPVEYEIPGLQQSQINYSKGYSYADGLKSILRQDPDIIMVGEIRDLETAEIAINAALTGHLVISTLHTNTAIEAISRLLNMGVKPYMLAPALNLIIGQRLLRKLHTCSGMKPASMGQKQDIEIAIKKIKDIKPRLKLNFDGNVASSIGCDECNGDGYQGRIAVVETFDLNDDIKDAIINNKSTLEVYGLARQYGFLSMKEDAYIKMLNGLTTIDEIRRVL